MTDIANVMKALSDETRLRILNLLYEKEELCVCDIMETLEITQTKASRHLGYLKKAGLVSDKKVAQWVHYSLISPDEIKGMSFIKGLVEETLRGNPVYKKDLTLLGEWLKQKNVDC